MTTNRSHIRHGHGANADSLFVQFEGHAARYRATPARLQDARVNRQDEGRWLEDLLRLHRQELEEGYMNDFKAGEQVWVIIGKTTQQL